jgi:hypothetical protein
MYLSKYSEPEVILNPNLCYYSKSNADALFGNRESAFYAAYAPGGVLIDSSFVY